MNDKILLSVIIPAYNVEKYVGSCLDSVLLQSMQKFEVLCIDDGSTDGTLNILKEYSLQDSRIKVIANEKNEGTAYSRNKGIENAAGKYIYFLDADDLIKPNMFNKLTEIADDNNLDCIYFGSEIKDDENIGAIKLRFCLPNLEKRILSGIEIFNQLIINNAYTGSVWRQFWNGAFLKENKLRFPDGLWGEDAEFSVKAMLSVQRGMCLEEIFHVYRRHGGTMSTNMSPYKTISLFKIYCNLIKFWSKQNWDIVTNDNFEKYMNMRLQQVKRLYFRNEGTISEDNFAPGMERHLFTYALKNSEFITDVDICKQDLKTIGKYKNIYIYGAGIYAGDVIEVLKKNNIAASGLVITKRQLNTMTINHLPLFEIDELCEKFKDNLLDLCIVLGVKNELNKKNIMTELSVRGISNIISPHFS